MYSTCSSDFQVMSRCYQTHYALAVKMQKLGRLARRPTYQLPAGHKRARLRENLKCIEAAHGGAGRPGYGSCLCEGSNETTIAVVKITTSLSTLHTHHSEATRFGWPAGGNGKTTTKSCGYLVVSKLTVIL